MKTASSSQHGDQTPSGGASAGTNTSNLINEKVSSKVALETYACSSFHSCETLRYKQVVRGCYQNAKYLHSSSFKTRKICNSVHRLVIKKQQQYCLFFMTPEVPQAGVNGSTETNWENTRKKGLKSPVCVPAARHVTGRRSPENSTRVEASEEAASGALEDLLLLQPPNATSEPQTAPTSPPSEQTTFTPEVSGTEVRTHSDGGRGVGGGVELNANEALDQLCF